VLSGYPSPSSFVATLAWRAAADRSSLLGARWQRGGARGRRRRRRAVALLVPIGARFLDRDIAHSRLTFRLASMSRSLEISICQRYLCHQLRAVLPQVLRAGLRATNQIDTHTSDSQTARQVSGNHLSAILRTCSTSLALANSTVQHTTAHVPRNRRRKRLMHHRSCLFPDRSPHPAMEDRNHNYHGHDRQSRQRKSVRH
jgi:hypothetical protein